MHFYINVSTVVSIFFFSPDYFARGGSIGLVVACVPCLNKEWPEKKHVQSVYVQINYVQIDYVPCTEFRSRYNWMRLPNTAAKHVQSDYEKKKNEWDLALFLFH